MPKSCLVTVLEDRHKYKKVTANINGKTFNADVYKDSDYIISECPEGATMEEFEQAEKILQTSK